jgi:peptidoglycan/LPS O-acetylase OafA/YrhL
MFIAGIIMYQLYKNPKLIMPHIIIVLCTINQFISQGLSYTIFFVVVIGIFYLIVYKEKFLKSGSYTINNATTFLIAPIEFIAKISYPLYLIHQFIGFGILKMMEDAGLENEVFIIIPITISIGLAYLLHRFVEVPSAKFLLKVNSFERKAVI